jgi:hypothetical protein
VQQRELGRRALGLHGRGERIEQRLRHPHLVAAQSLRDLTRIGQERDRFLVLHVGDEAPLRIDRLGILLDRNAHDARQALGRSLLGGAGGSDHGKESQRDGNSGRPTMKTSHGEGVQRRRGTPACDRLSRQARGGRGPVKVR